MTVEVAFGRVLRQHRQDRGFSQEELSYQSGVNRTFISHLETGRNKATIDTLLRLSSALNVPAAQIISEVEGLLEDT